MPFDFPDSGEPPRLAAEYAHLREAVDELGELTARIFSIVYNISGIGARICEG